MKSMIVNSLCFGVGLAAGVIFTSLYWKKKMDMILADSEDLDSDYIRGYENEFSEPGVEVNPREEGPLSQEERDEIRNKLINNYEKTSSYATMYKDESQAAEEEHPVDDDEDEEAYEIERANAEHKENFNKPPKIISAEEFSNLPAYVETGALYFYHYDNVLVDDDEEEVDEGMLVGDCLDRFDFRNSKEEEIIFVMNYQIDKAFEIHRVMGSWNSGDPEVD